MPAKGVAGKRVRKKAAQKKPKRPFRVFEAGSGAGAEGLLKRASKAVKTDRTYRRFLGVDLDRPSMQALLKAAELAKRGILIDLARKCAVGAVAGLEPGSHSLIFAGYFINAVPASRAGAFLRASKTALRPGGRLALVQDKAAIPIFRAVATRLGMSFHFITISDRVAGKSPARAIRARSNPTRRESRIGHYILSNPSTAVEITSLVRRRIIESRNDYARPTIILLRKPRPGEKLVPRASGLSSFERQTVKAMLGV